MSTWSIENELCSMSDESDWRAALSKLGLPSDRSVRLVADGPWYASGAESYLFKFAVQSHSHAIDLVFKALVSSGGNLTARSTEIRSRRALLGNAGIQTPRLYGYGRATVLEEYIPEALSTVLSDEKRMAEVAPKLIEVALKLDGLGFQSPYFVNDLRTRGTDVVMIDFGFDLGDPGQGDSGTCLRSACASLLRAGLRAATIDDIVVALTSRESKNMGAVRGNEC